MMALKSKRFYCWVVEREVEVVEDQTGVEACTIRFGKGDGTLTAKCPWRNSWMCPLRESRKPSGGRPLSYRLGGDEPLPQMAEGREAGR